MKHLKATATLKKDRESLLLDLTEIKRAEEEVRRRNRELYVLNNIAVTFNQSFDLDEILQLTMLQIVELFSTDTSAVYLFDEATRAMQKKSSYGHRSSWVTENENFVLPLEFVDTVKSARAEIINHHDLPRFLKHRGAFIHRLKAAADDLGEPLASAGVLIDGDDGKHEPIFG